MCVGYGIRVIKVLYDCSYVNLRLFIHAEIRISSFMYVKEMGNLLYFKEGMIVKDIFKNISVVFFDYICTSLIGSLLIFIKNNRINVITFYKMKYKIKNIQKLIIDNYNVQNQKEMLLDIFIMTIKMFGMIVYLIIYYLIKFATKEIKNIIFEKENIIFIEFYVFLLIFIVPLLGQINIKTKKEKIISAILIEDIYILTLFLLLDVKYSVKIINLSVLIMSLGLIILREFKYISGREYENKLILEIKLLRFTIVFFAGIVNYFKNDLFIVFICAAIVIAGIESIFSYELDTSKHFTIKIKKNNNEILTTKESVVMCNDGRLGIISEDNNIIFIERDEIQYITYNMEYKYLFKNTKIRITDEKGSKEFDDYFWRNKEWIFCKKKESDSNRKYKIYVYDVKKVKQIELI